MARAKSSGHNRNHAALLKFVAALQTDRRIRDRDRLFFANGVRNFIQAVDNAFEIERIFTSERLLTVPIAQKLVRQCRRNAVPVETLTPEQFRALSPNSRASGIAAIVRQRWSTIADIMPDAGLCWTLVETVRSPGNLGTLLRTSQAVGGAGFILIGDAIDPYAPEVARASMGAIYRQRLVRTTWSAVQQWVKEHGCPVIGASPDGTEDLHRIPALQNPLLVLGEERRGLTAGQRQLCSSSVRIPMESGTDSLNLGVAGGLLLYELYRHQRAANS